MERRDLNRMFDALAPTPEQERAMLRRLLEPERKVRPMKKLKKLTVVGIAAALMLISCAAAVVTRLDQRLLDYFGAGPEQAELLAPGAVPVDVTAEDNGAALHVTQVLMDRHTLMILAEFTAPEGVVLDNKGMPFMDSDSFELKFLNRDGQSCSEKSLSSYGFTRRFLEDGDPLDNHMTVLFDIQMNQGVADERASYFRLSFTDFGWYDFDLRKFVSLYSGTWSCDIPLPQEDIGRTYEVGIPVAQTDGVNIILKKFYLSPMTLHITLEREIPVSMDKDDVAVRHRWQWVLDRENSVVLKDREGRVIPLQVGGGSAGFQEQEQPYRLAEITDLRQLQGGILTVLGHDIPLDNLVSAE